MAHGNYKNMMLYGVEIKQHDRVIGDKLGGPQWKKEMVNRWMTTQINPTREIYAMVVSPRPTRENVVPLSSYKFKTTAKQQDI